MQPPNPQVSQESIAEQNERNKLAALKMADGIFEVITSEEFQIQCNDPELRHRMLTNKYPNFAKAYPVVFRLLVRELKYKREVFSKWLDRLQENPGKGMEGFIERQADYARMLYLSTSKGRRNRNFAHKIWRIEYDNMYKCFKKIREEEEQARNEFAEEEAEHAQERRKELLEFANLMASEKPESPWEELSSLHEDAERLQYGLPLKNPNPSFATLDTSELDYEELCLLYRESLAYEQKLITLLEQKNEQIQKLEEELLVKVRKPKPKPRADPEWLAGTSASKPVKGSRRKRRGN